MSEENDEIKVNEVSFNIILSASIIAVLGVLMFAALTGLL